MRPTFRQVSFSLLLQPMPRLTLFLRFCLMLQPRRRLTLQTLLFLLLLKTPLIETARFLAYRTVL